MYEVKRKELSKEIVVNINEGYKKLKNLQDQILFLKSFRNIIGKKMKIDMLGCTASSDQDRTFVFNGSEDNELFDIIIDTLIVKYEKELEKHKEEVVFTID